MQMLYKSPGAHTLGNYPDGATFDYVVVAPADIEAHLLEGWAMTPDEALNAPESEQQAPEVTEAAPEPKRRGRPPKVKP